MGAFAASLLDGVAVTIWVTGSASVLAIGLATLFGLMRRSGRGLPRLLARLYVELFRGLPLVVQLFWLFYVLPMFGVTLPAALVGILALGLCFGAYGAEIVRSAREAVPEGQVDAARSLGMGRVHTFFLVVLAQLLRIALPQFGNLLVDLLKSSALVSFITLHDVTFNAQNIILETRATGIVFVIVLAIYYGIASLILFAIRSLERRLAWPSGK